jgi:hypothetical protein
MAVAGYGDAGAMRKWWMVAAGAVVAAALAWTAVEALRPEEGCACAVPPQLDHVPGTADRWLTAVQTGDAPAAWSLLTRDAQRRHGDVDRLRAELPALAERFGSTGTAGRWQEVDTRTQGMNTPSRVFLIRVTIRDGVPAAVAGLVIHSNATREDPGRIDPDLGEPIQFGTADPSAPLTLPGQVRVANPDGKYLEFLGVPVAAPAERVWLGLSPVKNLGGGVYQIDSAGHQALTGAGLLIAIVQRPDGRFAFGAAPVSFDTR